MDGLEGGSVELLCRLFVRGGVLLARASLAFGN